MYLETLPQSYQVGPTERRRVDSRHFEGPKGRRRLHAHGLVVQNVVCLGDSDHSRSPHSDAGQRLLHGSQGSWTS